MESRQVLSALRAAWWLPVVGMIMGGLAALALSLAATPLYTSHTQLFVSTTDTSEGNYEVLQGSQFSQQRVASYSRLLMGEELAGRVVDELDLDLAPAELIEQVTATAIPETVLLDVAVTDASPERARDITRTIGEEFPRLVGELEAPEGGGASPVKVTVTQRPSLPTDPSSPQTLRNVGAGGLVGLLAGVGIVLARARLDRTIKDADDAAELAGAPVIGTVLRDSALDKRHVIEQSRTSRTAEDYRQLRTNLQFLNIDDPPRVIMVSSAVPSEGKTTVIVNLGVTLAEAGRRVTIVEADLRRPKVTRYLGLVSGVGLTNVLTGTADVEEVAQRYGEGDLYVIGAGPTPPNPGELLSSSHMSALLDKLRGQNDFVLVDAPPLLPVADASGLAGFADGVLLSVRYGSTHKNQLRQAASMLDRVGATTLGVILNIVPPKAEVATAYGYGYSYGYANERTRSSGRRAPDGR